MPAITPNFLFNTQALEAAEFYVSIFPNSKITETSYYADDAPMPSGTVLVTAFVLDGMEFQAINAGEDFAFIESVSFRVNCADQAQVDHYWEKLTDGGEEGQCGWLKDRFGVNWQVSPEQMGAYMGDPDPVRASKAAKAMLGMKKLDLAVFEAAVNAP